MNKSSITVPRWFDRHLHIRDNDKDMLKMVLPCTLAQRATGAVIMGNLPYPDTITSIAKALAYRERITSHIPPGSDFKPRMALYLTDDISPEEVVLGFQQDAWCAVKLYMANQKGQGGTTGSQHGVRNLLGRYPVLEAMQRHTIPLLGHFEAVEENIDEFDREIFSIERDLKPILRSFPELPVVVEHLTDGRAAQFVAQTKHNNIHATVTAHHLMINSNAMFWNGMNPGNYCKPVPKNEMHRQWVRKLVTSGNRRFGAGTDSAPHPQEAKSRYSSCAAGIFTAPVAVELYTTVFDEDNALQHLGAFLSENFLDLYGMKVSSETMTLVRTPLVVPEMVGPIHVFKGGTELPWKLVTMKG